MDENMVYAYGGVLFGLKKGNKNLNLKVQVYAEGNTQKMTHTAQLHF